VGTFEAPPLTDFFVSFFCLGDGLATYKSQFGGAGKNIMAITDREIR